MNDKYIDLVANFYRLNGKKNIKTILFTGVQMGDGASTTAMNFAQTLAEYMGHTVLFIANFNDPSAIIYDSIDVVDVADASKDQKSFELTLIKKQEKLQILTKLERSSDPIKHSHSDFVDQLLMFFHEDFKYIVIDSDPILISPEYSILCSEVDAVILVTEAGKTKRHIAHKAIDIIEESGAEFLGVVLNRRKYFIPNWLYKRF